MNVEKKSLNHIWILLKKKDGCFDDPFNGA